MSDDARVAGSWRNDPSEAGLTEAEHSRKERRHVGNRTKGAGVPRPAAVERSQTSRSLTTRSRDCVAEI